MIDIYKDPIWEMMDAFCHPFFSGRKLSDNGFKSIIGRPHDLVNIKNDEGKVVAQELRVVTTPFKKEDVKVKICDNVLSVACGCENIKAKDDEEFVFKGISSQSYSFALSLGPSIDQSKITAKNDDGVLKINMPLIIEEEKKPREIEVVID